MVFDNNTAILIKFYYVVNGFFASVDNFDVMRIMIENFISVFGDQDKILDPAAEYFREIYARFNGVDVAGFRESGVGGADVAVFMILHTDEMAQAVGEVLPVAAFGDDVSGCLVNVTQSDTRLNDCLGFLVGSSDQVVDILLFKLL